MIDVGIITGSGIYELPGEPETRVVETRFGEAEVAVSEIGPWTVGGISRHRKGHHHLPHTIPHRANLAALKQLGARAALATTVVGVVDPDIPLGRPILFDDLFFPENRLPDGEACTMFPEPGEAGRGHLIQTEPFAPRLRQRTELAAGGLGIETTVGGVYGHVNGPPVQHGGRDPLDGSGRGGSGEPDVRPRGGAGRGAGDALRASGLSGKQRHR